TGKTVVFTSYYDNGYDLYLLQNPFREGILATPLSLPAAAEIPPSAYTGISSGAATDYSMFVFNRLFSGVDNREEKIDSSKIVPRAKTADGAYPEHDYHVQLAPDLVIVSASYSPYFRMQGSGLLAFGDVLGNHQLYIALDLNRSTENSNFYANYQYLARRINLSQGAYHFAYPYYSNGVIWRDRNYGLFAAAGYPLNRYNRVELGLDYLVIDRSVYWTDLPYSPSGVRISALLPSLGYVHDTSVWHASTEPGNGGRWRVDALWSPNLTLTGDRSLEFHTFAVDWRQYINYRKDYTFAFRASGGLSQGPNPQRFYLGGMVNWFNPRYDNIQGEALVDRVEDIYFASFITPLRGVGFYNQVGTRYLLGNAEFRFPFIRHLVFGWPLPAYIRNLRGSLFTDYGAAWTPYNAGVSIFPKKGVFGFGFGLRIDLGIIPLEWDVGWSPDPSSDMVPRHYLSINLGF
ncbi:MAG: BamA/TamA family outer membrane protein, partial [Calditrichota bacterium]